MCDIERLQQRAVGESDSVGMVLIWSSGLSTWHWVAKSAPYEWYLAGGFDAVVL